MDGLIDFKEITVHDPPSLLREKLVLDTVARRMEADYLRFEWAATDYLSESDGIQARRALHSVYAESTCPWLISKEDAGVENSQVSKTQAQQYLDLYNNMMALKKRQEEARGRLTEQQSE